MVENTDKSQSPEFGVNGAVLNAPTMSDEMRAEYLGLSESPRPQELSALSKLIFTVSILLSAYVAGMKHPITADSSTIDNLCDKNRILPFKDSSSLVKILELIAC